MNGIAQMPVGTPLKITYKRGNETHTVEVKTELLEERYAQQSCFDQWGICLEKLTRAYAREHKVGTKTGLRVIGLQPSFSAQDAGIALNDVIVSANKKPIRDFNDLQEIYQAYVKKPDKILLEVIRGQSTLFLVLKPTTTKSPF
jgi:membrane-associated protease RseP (regulator of RpoE activity)